MPSGRPRGSARGRTPTVRAGRLGCCGHGSVAAFEPSRGPDLARPRRDRAPMVEARSSFAALRSFSRRGCRKPHSVPRLVALSRPGGRWFYRVGSRILPFGLGAAPGGFTVALRASGADLLRAAARRSLPEAAGGRIASGAWSSCRRQGGRWLYRVDQVNFPFWPSVQALGGFCGGTGARLARTRSAAAAWRLLPEVAGAAPRPALCSRFAGRVADGCTGLIATLAFGARCRPRYCFAVAQARVWPRTSLRRCGAAFSVRGCWGASRPALCHRVAGRWPMALHRVGSRNFRFGRLRLPGACRRRARWQARGGRPAKAREAAAATAGV